MLYTLPDDVLERHGAFTSVALYYGSIQDIAAGFGAEVWEGHDDLDHFEAFAIDLPESRWVISKRPRSPYVDVCASERLIVLSYKSLDDYLILTVQSIVNLAPAAFGDLFWMRGDPMTSPERIEAGKRLFDRRRDSEPDWPRWGDVSSECRAKWIELDGQ